MLKPPVDQCILISQSCISYLNERFVFEKGLFRSPVSLTDVRLLQTEMIQGSMFKLRKESDPHIVTGVLQKTLKEMVPPTFYEAYEDIIATEISEDSNFSRLAIRSWLVKLPQERLELVRTLFALLQRIVTIGGNDSNAMQLAYYMAPFLCRRENSAYMSLRHMEDLRKIRPVLSFLIENYSEIFALDIKPISQMKHQQPSISVLQKTIPFPLHIEPDYSPPEISLKGLVVNTNMNKYDAGMGSEDEGDVGGDNFKNHSTENIFSSNIEDSQAQNPAIHTWEWKILKSIVFSKVNSLLEGDKEDGILGQKDSNGDSLQRNKSRNAESENVNDFQTKTTSDPNNSDNIQEYNKMKNRRLYTNDDQSMDFKENGKRERSTVTDRCLKKSPSEGYIDIKVVNSSNVQKLGYSSIGGEGKLKGERRRMVTNCKALRAQIVKFEESRHGQAGNSTDRGSMQEIYTQYRDMKRDIRDSAARDLQRCIRGYLTRCRLNKFARIFNFPIGDLPQGDAVPFSSQGVPCNDERKHDSEGGSISMDIGDGDFNGPFVKTNVDKNKSHFDHVFDHANDHVKLGIVLGTIGIRDLKELAVNEDHDLGDEMGNIALQSSINSNVSLDGRQREMNRLGDTDQLTEMYAQYKLLLGKKRDLKKDLKSFDETFSLQNGRTPRKTDKEVMRPLYQKYQEVKTELDALQAHIESKHGPILIPQEDLSESERPYQNTESKSNGASMKVKGSALGGKDIHEKNDHYPGKIDSKFSDSRLNIEQFDTTEAAGASSSFPPSIYPLKSTIPLKSFEMFSNTMNSSNTNISVERNNDEKLELLLEEKRTLHAYLKTYERDFNRIHGRAVMKHEDIQPVADEYQRYKELKSEVKDMRGPN
jgi:hypothetical protein